MKSSPSLLLHLFLGSTVFRDDFCGNGISLVKEEATTFSLRKKTHGEQLHAECHTAGQDLSLCFDKPLCSLRILGDLGEPFFTWLFDRSMQSQTEG